MARTFETLIGKRVKRWVVVEDHPAAEKGRKERIRCVACGREKRYA